MKTKAVKKKGSFMKQLKRDRSLWLFCLPGVILTFIFSYIPMYGVQIAFRRVNAKDDIVGSNWLGLYDIQRIFEYLYLEMNIVNTLILSRHVLIVSVQIVIPLAQKLKVYGHPD